MSFPAPSPETWLEPSCSTDAASQRGATQGDIQALTAKLKTSEQRKQSDLKRLDNDTKVLVVAFILNFFIERLNKNLSVRKGIQPLQMVLFVDEAHNVLPKDSKAKLLEKLAREGRSWGFPLWLASQDADKFISSGVDFAELASAGLHFSPETLSSKEQKDILGKRQSPTGSKKPKRCCG